MVQQDARRGLLFALLAILIFAAQDGISKHMAQTYPPVFVVMIRYWAFAAFVVVWAARGEGGLKAAAATDRVWLQLFRGALLSAQIVVAITAFAVVGLAPTLALFAAAPLVVAALSVPVLGESVGWRRWTAIGVGFVGVLIIVRPGPGLMQSDIWIAVVATLGIAIYGVLTRLVSRTDSSRTSFFYTGVGGVLVVTLIGPFYWTSFAPWDWMWMAILCVTGASGHYFLIRALEITDAVIVQPMQYLQTVLGTFTGVFVFNEILEWEVVAGAALVVGAGLFAAWREARRARGA
jgi:drug/metabolite transporter (DMT)-like permease